MVLSDTSSDEAMTLSPLSTEALPPAAVAGPETRERCRAQESTAVAPESAQTTQAAIAGVVPVVPKTARTTPTTVEAATVVPETARATPTTVTETARRVPKAYGCDFESSS